MGLEPAIEIKLKLKLKLLAKRHVRQCHTATTITSDIRDQSAGEYCDFKGYGVNKWIGGHKPP